MNKVGEIVDLKCKQVLQCLFNFDVRISLSFICLAFFWNSASAESTLDIYGGFQTSPHSKVRGEYYLSGSRIPLEFTAGWDGKSFSLPPYYGVRYTRWDGNRGWGLDFNHTKAYADNPTLVKNGFTHLQFTDGLNNLTLHQQRKFSVTNKIITPYFGYGIGVTLPHVEIQFDELHPLTFEYQYGGITSAFNSGIRYPMGPNRTMFVEYKFTASWLDVNINGGGFLKTRIFTNALNLGYSFKF